MQSGFFDNDNRFSKLNELDSLQYLNKAIDWEIFRPLLKRVINSNKKKTGRPPYDLVLMFKILVLQNLYNISDDQIEFQILDRMTFCRFLGLSSSHKVPDSKTIWAFREKLVKHNLMKKLFDRFEEELSSNGYKARKGQIVDASFVNVPRQRNKKEDNESIKAGVRPQSFDENSHVGSQKDTDARWAKKNSETHFGYKDHVAIDNKHKLVRNFEVTSANVHDSQVFEGLLTENTSKDVWADSAYQSEHSKQELESRGFRNRVHKKGKRGKPLTKRDQNSNTTKSRVRVRVKHVFGAITNEQGGLYFRVIGFARNAFKIGMMNLVYNFRRFTYLHRKVAR